MRVTKNKLKEEFVLAQTISVRYFPRADTSHRRYGALSSGLQTSNNATTPRTPSKKGTSTPRATATPTSRKRARKTPEQVGCADETEEEEEELPVGKKAKAATLATNGNGAKRSEVKSEPGLDQEAAGGEEEVSFF